MDKPLTKALHTVRVVERVAAYLVKQNGAAAYSDALSLHYAVLSVLGNHMAEDPALAVACGAACARVLK